MGGGTVFDQGHVSGLRSIPAWAGEPHAGLRGEELNKVCGLSPRGRGNPSPHSHHWPAMPVYPRVGGGTSAAAAPKVFMARMGLSPRGRGNQNVRHRYGHLSPRGRGNRGRCLPKAVYPRVGGGTCLQLRIIICYPGLSPRGRGNRCAPSLAHASGRSIPAWAGEPLCMTTTSSSSTVYPRVGGGTSSSNSQEHVIKGLSPRGRGNRLPVPDPHIVGRSIPAWAGEPYNTWKNLRARRVYPRVGGGTYVLSRI